MKCYNCGTELTDDAQYCDVCGAAVSNQEISENVEELQSGACVNYAPALQLPTGRGLLKMIFLSIITLGIYGIVIWCRISDEINIVASRSDGKRTMNYLGMMMLNSITFGIFGFVWNHKFANRIGAELVRRGYDYKFGASSYWLWNVLGSFILVGPYVYTYKLMKSMNMLNASYNYYG